MHTPTEDRSRGRTASRGYDAKHRALRILCFKRDGWRCVDCDWEPDLVRQCRELNVGPPPVESILEELRQRYARHERHLHADHIIPVEERPDLRLALDNLATRCDHCHRIRTNKMTAGQIDPNN